MITLKVVAGRRLESTSTIARPNIGKTSGSGRCRCHESKYVFPCYFVGDPNAPLAKTRNLLGLAGVINHVRLTFDGPPSVLAPFGVLVVEKK
jgi:hypothetical protein